MTNKTIESKLYIASVKPLSDKALFKVAYDKLPAWRQEKVDEQKFAKGKALSMGAGLLLDYALSNAGINPKDAQIDYGEHEKPYIKGSNIYFNLSHSEEYVICAISNYEIGCDIEKIDSGGEKIAKRFFHEKEFDRIASSENEAEKLELFYELWTLKESFIKVTGQGLHLPLSSFQIIIGDEITIEQAFNNKEYYFQEFNVVSGYKCAVCTTEKEQLDFEIIDIKKLLTEI